MSVKTNVLSVKIAGASSVFVEIMKAAKYVVDQQWVITSKEHNAEKSLKKICRIIFLWLNSCVS